MTKQQLTILSVTVIVIFLLLINISGSIANKDNLEDLGQRIDDIEWRLEP